MVNNDIASNFGKRVRATGTMASRTSKDAAPTRPEGRELIGPGAPGTMTSKR